MQNRKYPKNDTNSFLTAVGGAVVLGAMAIPFSPVLGIGTIGVGVGGLVLDFFIKSDKGSSNSKVSVIEKIFFDNGVRKYEGDGKFSIPEVIDAKDVDGRRVIDLRVPIGMSVKELQRGYYAIKDYFNCIDIDFNAKGEGLYEMVLTFEAQKPKDRSPWDILWIENGMFVGEKPNVELPMLLNIEKIEGGALYTFKLPIGKSTFHLSKMDITLKEFLNARSIKIKHIKGNIIGIEAIYEDIPSDVSFELVKRDSKDNLVVVIGKGLSGFIRLNLTKLPNILIAGATGSGKSVCVKSLLMYLLCMYTDKELKVYISDLKKTELNRFKNIKHVKYFTDDVKSTETMIATVYTECERRLSLFKEKGVSDVVEYNSKVSREDKLPFIFVVIEEFVRYSTGEGREVKARKDKLSELLFICRATGISFGLTVQRPTKNNLGEDIKSSLGNIIGLRTMNAENSKVICGDANMLSNLRGYGNGYIFNDLGTEEFQGFNIDNDLIGKYIKEYNLNI